MEGLAFQIAAPAPAVNPARADVACFIGFVRRRGDVSRRAGESDERWLNRVLPAWVYAALQAAGWLGAADARPAADLAALLDVPVPLESWDAFDGLYAWNERPVDGSGRRCPTLLGTAVRTFFARGGRRCHVVRVGDPWPVDAGAAVRRPELGRLLPSLPPPRSTDRESWRGVGHVFGLPDVSFLCLPDLPDLFAADLPRGVDRRVPVAEEKFVPLPADEAVGDRFPSLRATPPPRCDAGGFRDWSNLIGRVGALLRDAAREVQLIAAVPLPADAVSPGAEVPADVARSARNSQWTRVAEINTAFVQLAYPWLRTPESEALPGALEPPDAALAGVLAHHALTRGAWFSALRREVSNVSGVVPDLDRAALARPLGRHTLRDRVSLIAPTPAGFQLLSDVTTFDGEACRHASINRLTSALVRAARIVGGEAVFENNGERLWRRLTDRLHALLTAFWRAGALAGASPAEAFEVVCDRTTMSQSDLDAGRAVVRIVFNAATPIQRIVVVLAVNEGGEVSLPPAAGGGGAA